MIECCVRLTFFLLSSYFHRLQVKIEILLSAVFGVYVIIICDTVVLFLIYFSENYQVVFSLNTYVRYSRFQIKDILSIVFGVYIILICELLF